MPDDPLPTSAGAVAAPRVAAISGPVSSTGPSEPLSDELPVTPDEHRPAGVGVLHAVLRGQTLYRIALTYGVPLQQLAEVNDIDDPARIVAGQRLWIPGAVRLLEVPITVPITVPGAAAARVVRRPAEVPPADVAAPSPPSNASTASPVDAAATPSTAASEPVVADATESGVPRVDARTDAAAAARARAIAEVTTGAMTGVATGASSAASGAPVAVDTRSESAPRKVTPPAPVSPVSSPARVAVEEPEPKLEVNKDRFAWPVAGGTLVKRYGVIDGEQHDGIDILAPVGSPVLAVDAGVVLHAGELSGYGLIVAIRHADGLITLYAHNQSNLVHAGQKVRRGERVATLGESGRTSGPHLHLEVRKARLPRNPLFFLKPPAVAAASSTH